MAKGGRKGGGATIVLKREEVGGHGHHGGAWKVAYADFVTAMMAFFLLMWLLNATTEEQRRGLADYFAPTNVLGHGASGSGQPFGGATPHAPEGMASDTGAMRLEAGRLPVMQDIELDDHSETEPRPVATRDGTPGADDAPEARPARLERVAAGDALPGPAAGGARGRESDRAANQDVERDGGQELARASAEALRRELEQRERQALDGVAAQLRAALAEDPALSALANQIRVEHVPEGLRIQMLDAERLPMFATGGAAPNERSRAVLARVAAAVSRVPNPVAITGHTDAAPFRGGERTNWDLSAERANATRRLLAEGGVPESRVHSVAGLAGREPLLPAEPGAAANRRVAILLLRQVPAPGTTPR